MKAEQKREIVPLFDPEFVKNLDDKDYAGLDAFIDSYGPTWTMKGDAEKSFALILVNRLDRSYGTYREYEQAIEHFFGKIEPLYENPAIDPNLVDDRVKDFLGMLTERMEGKNLPKSLENLKNLFTPDRDEGNENAFSVEYIKQYFIGYMEEMVGDISEFALGSGIFTVNSFNAIESHIKAYSHLIRHDGQEWLQPFLEENPKFMRNTGGFPDWMIQASSRLG